MRTVGGTQDGTQKRRQKLFVPMTVKMVQDATPGPDEACELDGGQFSDVSIF